MTPDEEFLIGHSDGQPVAFFFSQKKKASAYRELIKKPDLVIVKEDAKVLTEELVELGVKEAFVDPETVKNLPDPLFLPKYLEHLTKEGAEA